MLRALDRLRALPPLIVDSAIALACYAAALTSALDKGRGGQSVVLVAAVASLPLIWRRRHPILVTVVLGAATVWLASVQAINQLPLGQLVATYTFAALCPPRWRLVAALGTAVGITASLLMPQTPITSLPAVLAGFVGAYGLGSASRARGDRIALLEARADQLAERQAAAAARERERIARDMHDILAHSMSLIVVQAEAGPVVVRTDPARAETVFDNIAAAGRAALGQLRRTLGVLRADDPGRAPQPDLDGLAGLAEQGRQAGLAVSLEQHGQARPAPPEVHVAAYRIVQESITNTVKHAGASQVWISLAWADDQLRLDIRDDGTTRQPPDAGGFGLIGMRERVRACGGQLSTGPAPDGTGFVVAAALPLNGQAPRG